MLAANVFADPFQRIFSSVSSEISNLWFESTHHIARGIDDVAAKGFNGVGLTVQGCRKSRGVGV
jgi:hypothetical protein